ncbi:alkaline phosphatase family protein [Aegicerativicinus sediminis]|uniref:alkaline phosphatase family protein n=1 Tax=Aegicerativicinus sediminis TaxID=2893202 RepID=UPI001E53AB01|nr:ectonucleotide pyrophosphatase/phosphodiesterase [Aegicerativicinus sediminis]
MLIAKQRSFDRNYRILRFLMLLLAFLAFSSCSQKLRPTITKAPTENSKTALNQPYVLLISCDGFRWDYVDRFHPPNLSKFIKDGVHAESLIPSFPTKTFPNHYTIATGMYPDKHGIVNNHFYSYDHGRDYKVGDNDVVPDGKFYKGTPIWVQAAKHGMVTASYFFVGTEADIQGIYPTYYKPYNGRIKNEARVNQVIDWLNLPEKIRPHFISLYFSDLDGTGHRYGPNNDEKIKETLFRLDTVLGQLFIGIEKTNLPVNTIIVSDHGMIEVPYNHMIPITKIEDESKYKTYNVGTMASLHLKDLSQKQSIYNDLKSLEDHFKVYFTVDTPGFEYSPKNKNFGDIQLVTDTGYIFASKDLIDRAKAVKAFTGQHGYDPSLKEMHGIFYGNGPAFKQDFKINSIKNIHIYPLLCRILDLPIPKNIDGKFRNIKTVLK